MDKWILQESEAALSTPWLSVYKNQYVMADGKLINDYYILQRSDFVLVVATIGDSVVLVRQYRPATDRTYLCLPAGYVKENESAVEAAQRELREETGYDGTNFRQIGELHPLPGYIRSNAYIVIGEISTQDRSSFDIEEIDEIILVKWKDIPHLIQQGEILEMQAVSALLMARLDHSTVEP